MDPVHMTTLAYAGTRAAMGAGLVAVPRRVGAVWLGPRAGRRRAVTLPIRGLGGRDVALGAGTATAIVTGGPVRPWLAASALADAVDLGSALAVPAGKLPEHSRTATAAMAGLGAALGVALALLSDR
jgi:hypothetical protein